MNGNNDGNRSGPGTYVLGINDIFLAIFLKKSQVYGYFSHSNGKFPEGQVWLYAKALNYA